MRNFTLGLWACFIVLLVAGPIMAQPTWQWASGPATVTGTPNSIAAAASDALGNTWVTGSFSGTLTLGTTTLVSVGNADIFVARLNAAGQWTQAVRAGGMGNDYSRGLLMESSGVLAVVGEFSGTASFGSVALTSAGGADAFVARLSTSGQWTHAARSGGAGADAAYAVAAGGTGDLIVAGIFEGTARFELLALTSAGGSDVFVGRLNAAGYWNQVVGAGSDINDYCYAVATDATGNVTIAGYFQNTAAFGAAALNSAGGADAFVARLTPYLQWTQAMRAGGTGNDFGTALGLDAAGNSVLAGYFNGSAQFGSTTLISAGGPDVFVARLNPSLQWTQATRGGGPNNDVALALIVDAAGTATIAGVFRGITTFGSTSLPSVGGNDVFVARLNSAGQWMQAVQGGGAEEDYAYALAGNGTDMTIAGYFMGTTTRFGATTLLGSSSTIQTACVALLSGLVTAARVAQPAEVFIMAPNPTAAQVRLTWPEAVATSRSIQILDGMGRKVRCQELPARTNSTVLDVQSLVPGLYLVHCGAAISKLVVE